MKISLFFRKTYSPGDRCPFGLSPPRKRRFRTRRGPREQQRHDPGRERCVDAPTPGASAHPGYATTATRWRREPRLSGSPWSFSSASTVPGMPSTIARRKTSERFEPYRAARSSQALTAAAARNTTTALHPPENLHHAMTRSARIFKNRAPRVQRSGKIGDRTAPSPFRLGSRSSSFVGPAKMPQSRKRPEPERAIGERPPMEPPRPQ